MGKRKIKNKSKVKLFAICPTCNGLGYTSTLELIDRAKYKGMPQRVNHNCTKCDHGYVPYKQ